jgi:hypothetical protein
MVLRFLEQTPDSSQITQEAVGLGVGAIGVAANLRHALDDHHEGERVDDQVIKHHHTGPF